MNFAPFLPEWKSSSDQLPQTGHQPSGAPHQEPEKKKNIIGYIIKWANTTETHQGFNF